MRADLHRVRTKSNPLKELSATELDDNGPLRLALPFM
jgi:hypothetical protein